MHLRKIVLLFCLIFSGTTLASPLIVVFGDSLSAGYGLAAHQAWPDLLQQRLNSRMPGRHWQVFNASISGETSAGGLARLPATLAQHPAAIVILELGANDGLQGLSLPNLQDNLTAMIEDIHHSGARTLLAGVRLPPNYGLTYTGKFQQVYSNLARQNHITLLPSLLNGIDTQPELFQADRLHPTAAAEYQVLDNVCASLRPLLRSKSAQK